MAAKCLSCKKKVNTPAALDTENFTVYCSEFDKSEYRGLHNRVPTFQSDEMSNDPEKKTKYRMKGYEQTKDAGMKKTNKLIKKTQTKREYDPEFSNQASKKSY